MTNPLGEEEQKSATDGSRANETAIMAASSRTPPIEDHRTTSADADVDGCTGESPSRTRDRVSASRVQREASSTDDSEGKESPGLDRKLPPSSVGDDSQKEDANADASSSPEKEGGSGDVPEKLVFGLEHLRTEELPAFVKQNDGTLTFPEKLVLMLAYIERMSTEGATTRPTDESASIGWTRDGTGLVVRDKEHLTTTWLPQFFDGQTKFSSFVRKLYRWGFQKENPGADNELHHSNSSGGKSRVVLFANENFQRGNLGRLSNMKSVTASKSRTKSLTGSRRREGRAGGDGTRTKSHKSHHRIGRESSEEHKDVQQRHRELLAAPSTPSSGLLAISPQLQQLVSSQQHGFTGGSGGLQQSAQVLAQNALLQQQVDLRNIPLAASALGSASLQLPLGHASQQLLLRGLDSSIPGTARLDGHAVAGMPPYNPSQQAASLLLSERQTDQELTNFLQQAHLQSLGLNVGTTLQHQAQQQFLQDSSERERLVAMANMLLNEKNKGDPKPPP